MSWQDRIRDPALAFLLVLEICLPLLATTLAAKGLPIAPLIIETMFLGVVLIVAMLSHRPVAIAIILVGFGRHLGERFARIGLAPVAARVLRRCGDILAFSALTWVVSDSIYSPGRIKSIVSKAPMCCI